MGIRHSVKKYLLLHMVFLFVSSSAVLSKFAAMEDFLSYGFILFYGANLVVLFIYSICWQIVLKYFPLTLAYAQRGAITVWGLIWGIALFGESISPLKIIAAILIVCGTIILGGQND